MRVESCRPQRPVPRRLGLFSIVACLFLSPLASAETLLMMRAVCGGASITDKEGLMAGYENFVPLSSVHHDLDAPVDTDFLRQQPMRLTAFRVAKVFSGSSIGLIETMAKGGRCEEIQIDHLLPDGSGQMQVRWQLFLRNAYVSARKEWSGAGTEPPQDSFGFTPESFDWTYFREDGSPGPGFSWNFVTVSASM